jgi:acyl-CoA synthetase (AMP-forming)/AMP-acid ligase II/thioesterase domain-containing protein
MPGLLEERYRLGSSSSAILALGRQPLGYARLFEHCAATIALLNGAGISRGDRVAVVLPNGPEMATCFLAITMGASCAPLNPTYRRSEFEFYLSDLAPRALIVQDGIESPSIEVAESRRIRVIRLHPSIDQEAGIFSLDFGGPVTAAAPVFAQDGDEALVLHTSGTTARPKMVPLTQANLQASVENMIESVSLTAHDRCLNVMPLFHVSGIVGTLLASLASGASVVCTPGFYSPRFFEWCEEFAPTWYFGTPTMHQSLLARALQNPSVLSNLKLRFIRSAAAPMSAALQAEMERTFKVPVLQGYGMTEASQQVSVNPRPPKIRKPGSAGLTGRIPVAVMNELGNLLPTGEIGEIVVRGPTVTRGYANNPEANRESFVNGWFRTGDQGMVDADGYLFITGRLKEMINRGGQKISPAEIDEVLRTHPAVAQAVAFAVPDHRLGEEIAAAIVLRPGHVASEIEIRNHVAQLIADYKVPHRIVFLDELPKGPSGKLQRIGLAAQLGLDNLDGAAKFASRPSEYVAPRTTTERTLADIWRQVLRVERIGVNDDFLALGGDSMLAALAIARIRAASNARLSILAFFEHPTIAGLAELIDSPHSVRNATVPIQPHGALPPLFVVGSSQVFRDLARHLGQDQPVIGLTVPDELRMRLPYKLEELAAYEVNSILKYQDARPYFIAGFSAEGVLAYEVAQQLRAKGRRVGLLVMIDTACPSQPRQSLAVRTAQNVKIFLNKLRYEGINGTWISLSGRVRRLAIRLKLITWRIGNRLGVEFERSTPTLPDDFAISMATAARRYVPQPYEGPVLLIKRTGDLTRRYRLKDFGWSEVVGDGLEIFDIEGYHWTILTHPGVEALAKKLGAAMRRAREGAASVDSSAVAG